MARGERVQVFDGATGEVRPEIKRAFPKLARRFENLRDSERMLELADDGAAAGGIAVGDIVRWHRGSGGRHEGQRGYAEVAEIDLELGVATITLLRETARGLVLDGSAKRKTVALSFLTKVNKRKAGDVPEKNQQTSLSETDLSEGERYTLGGVAFEVVEDSNEAIRQEWTSRTRGRIADEPHISEDEALDQFYRTTGRRR